MKVLKVLPEEFLYQKETICKAGIKMTFKQLLNLMEEGSQEISVACETITVTIKTDYFQHEHPEIAKLIAPVLKPDSERLVELKKSLQEKTRDATKEVTRMREHDPNFLVGPRQKHFECGSCCMIVKDPIDCSKCQRLFCRLCVKNLDDCPSCKGKSSLD